MKTPAQTAAYIALLSTGLSLPDLTARLAAESSDLDAAAVAVALASFAPVVPPVAVSTPIEATP